MSSDISQYRGQLGLFLTNPAEPTTGKARRDGRRTMKQAALEAYPGTGTQRLRVLEMIIAAGDYGATDDEMQVALDMNPSTQRPRRVELHEGGWIEATDRTRRTRGKREAVVWILTPVAHYRLAARG